MEDESAPRDQTEFQAPAQPTTEQRPPIENLEQAMRDTIAKLEAKNQELGGLMCVKWGPKEHSYARGGNKGYKDVQGLIFDTPGEIQPTEGSSDEPKQLYVIATVDGFRLIETGASRDTVKKIIQQKAKSMRAGDNPTLHEGYTREKSENPQVVLEDDGGSSTITKDGLWEGPQKGWSRDTRLITEPDSKLVLDIIKINKDKAQQMLDERNKAEAERKAKIDAQANIINGLDEIL